jgi:D12 class N6 adenine-specific DNA methyltransferase
MQLKAGNHKKFGIPYQGSKTKIIDSIARFFPNADHFYDLFGGGFSVSHYMIENRSKSYKYFHYNEIRIGLCELIQDAINGKYNYDVFKPEWISREKFFKEKDANPYIKIIWSFGNNGEDYLFGKDIEESKRSMHQAVVFDEFDEFMKETFGITAWPNTLSITGKRLYLRCHASKKQRLDLEQLERLERLERLEQLERLHFTNLDYRKVKIENNSVIYCDIPYANTAKYSDEFNHKEFFDWAASQENPVFISEYEIKDDRFQLLKEFSHRSTFSSGGLRSIPVLERLYGNELAYRIIEMARNKKAELLKNG